MELWDDESIRKATEYSLKKESGAFKVYKKPVLNTKTGRRTLFRPENLPLHRNAINDERDSSFSQPFREQAIQDIVHEIHQGNFVAGAGLYHIGMENIEAMFEENSYALVSELIRYSDMAQKERKSFIESYRIGQTNNRVKGAYSRLDSIVSMDSLISGLGEESSEGNHPSDLANEYSRISIALKSQQNVLDQQIRLAEANIDTINDTTFEKQDDLKDSQSYYDRFSQNWADSSNLENETDDRDSPSNVTGEPINDDIRADIHTIHNLLRPSLPWYNSALIDSIYELHSRLRTYEAQDASLHQLIQKGFYSETDAGPGISGLSSTTPVTYLLKSFPLLSQLRFLLGISCYHSAIKIFNFLINHTDQRHEPYFGNLL